VCDTVQFKAELKDQGDRRVVRLSGALKGEMSSELTRLLEGILPPVQLDLAELVSADSAGLTTLASLEAQGAELVGASPYVCLQLACAGAKDPHKQRGRSYHRVTHQASRPASHARKKEDR
jgi:ABC-type transporter Mla MlaB component